MNNILFTLLTQSYDLIVIDEEATPLAAAPVSGGYYIYAVMAVVLAALLAMAAVWITRRNILKKRLMELRERSGNSDTSIPFSLKALKDAISEEEAVIV